MKRGKAELVSRARKKKNGAKTKLNSQARDSKGRCKEVKKQHGREWQTDSTLKNALREVQRVQRERGRNQKFIKIN